MCHYFEVLGSGEALALQIATAASILASIAFWMWVYKRSGVALMAYALPISLWVLFGTLDILITARGTLGDPMREGNPLARFVFVESGFLGPVVASVLWIAFWAGLVLAINRTLAKARQRLAEYVSLSVFYGLAFGHFLGFSSWFVPLCAVAEAARGVSYGFERFAMVVVAGALLGAAHLTASRILRSSAPGGGRTAADSRARRGTGNKGRAEGR